MIELREIKLKVLTMKKKQLKHKKVSELKGLICFLCMAIVGLPMSGDRPGVFDLSGPFALCALCESSSAFDIFTSEFELLLASLFFYFFYVFFYYLSCRYPDDLWISKSRIFFQHEKTMKRKFMVLSSRLFLCMIVFRYIYIIIVYLSFVLIVSNSLEQVTQKKPFDVIESGSDHY